MNGRVGRRLQPFAWVTVCVAVAALMGCDVTSKHKTETRAARSAPKAVGTAVHESEDPGINLSCLADHIRRTTSPFHWSYKTIAPPLTNVDWEADVTRVSIAGAVTDSSSTHAIHGLRTDPTSWNTAVMILAEPLPASAFALVSNSSAMVPAGKESVDGQPAIEYTIDTTQAASGEDALIRNVLGANGFIKGTAWVNTQGCPIKFVLNVEQHNNDGSVQKEHYELSVTQH